MARTVKHEEREGKRNEILDVAQRFVYTRGYEQMSIQDILDELKISKGAFYHYFDSKQALLEGFIDRMIQQFERENLPILTNTQLTAWGKFQFFISQSVQWKNVRRDQLIGLLKVWYHDDNALVRQKTTSRLMDRHAVILAAVLEEGLRDGTVRVSSPEITANLVLTLMIGLGESMARQILSLGAPDDTANSQEAMQKIEAFAQTYARVIEDALGAQRGSLVLIDKTTINAWINSWLATPEETQEI
jgi:AcrR family transcriptional regulator